MSFIKQTDRMDIYIEEARNTILIQEKWEYNWLTKVTPWTLVEKRKFHQMADNLIWKKWSGFFRLKVSGTSVFAQKHRNTTFTVNFDIKWVLEKPHWHVNVTKIISGRFERSNVNWTDKTINIDSEDTKIVVHPQNGKNYRQYPIAHEFGHTIGNTYNALIGQKSIHGDEYNTDIRINGGFFLDRLSIMNIGNDLRKRHLDFILLELNSMLSNTQFYII